MSREEMQPKVRFLPETILSSFPVEKEFPIQVFDLCKLRTYNLIGVKKFEQEMRKYGITRSRAYLIQGFYQRGEYEILMPDGTVVKGKPNATWLCITKYFFHWLIKIKYEHRKHHELNLDVEVYGTIEKHTTIPTPDTIEIIDTLDTQLEVQFNQYLRDFWQLRTTDLEYVYGADLETGIEEFRPIAWIIKEEKEPLEYDIEDVVILLSRGKGTPYVRRRDLEGDFYPYVEQALSNVVEYIMDSEFYWLMKQSKMMEESLEKRIKETIERVNKEKLIRAIRAIHSIGHIGLVENRIEKAYEEGLINYDDYMMLHELLLKTVRELIMKRAKEWCEKLRKAKSVSELNSMLRRIMGSKTWNSFYFQPAKSYVIECANNRLKELLKEQLREKEISKKTAFKRVYSYFMNQLEELEKQGVKSKTVVRDLNNLLRRVNRSNLPKEYKEKLIKRIEEDIRKFEEEKCNHLRERIEKANTLKELRSIKAELYRLRAEVKLCYDELMKIVTEKINKLREEKYRRSVERTLNKIRKAKGSERVDEILRMAYRLLRLPVYKQFEVFMTLINESKTIAELQAVFNIIKESPIAYNEMYYDKLVQLEDAYRRKLWSLQE